MGGHCIVDPTPEEEACSAAAVVMAVTPDGRVTTFKKMGSGSFHQQTLATAVELGKKANSNVFLLVLCTNAHWLTIDKEAPSAYRGQHMS